MDNHIVIITFNLPKYKKSPTLYQGSPNWMDRRIALFEQYTLPSFENQTNKDFHLIVLVDPNTPQNYLNILKSFEVKYNFFNILLTAEFRGSEYEQNLLEFYGKIKKNNTNVVLSSRCDNDDLIHITYIQQVKNLIKDYKVLSMSHGLYWDVNLNIFLDSVFPTGPFLTTQSTLDNYINPRYGNHHDVIRDNNPLIHKSELPMWIQIIHGENIWNSLEKMPGHRCKVNLNELEEHFGFKSK